jgi:hypothetical protein
LYSLRAESVREFKSWFRCSVAGWIHFLVSFSVASFLAPSKACPRRNFYRQQLSYFYLGVSCRADLSGQSRPCRGLDFLPPVQLPFDFQCLLVSRAASLFPRFCTTVSCLVSRLGFLSPARRDFLPVWNFVCPPDVTWVPTLILAAVTYILELRLHQLRILLRCQFRSSASVLIDLHQRGPSFLRAVI